MEAPGVTIHFHIASVPDAVEGYLHIVLFPDGQPCNIAVTLAKTGSHDRAVLTAWAHAVSMGLESGLPISRYVNGVAGMRYEPSGPLLVDGQIIVLEDSFVKHRAASVLDAIAAILKRRYCQ